jgi:hypothetical protein
MTSSVSAAAGKTLGYQFSFTLFLSSPMKPCPNGTKVNKVKIGATYTKFHLCDILVYHIHITHTAPA